MYIQLQITYPNVSEAQNAAKFLVDSRLAACVQIASGIESRYVWQDKTCVDSEVLLLCKTRAELFDEIAAKIMERHSYDCPQIVGTELKFVVPLYAKWMDDNIKKANE